jgi:hypothetical protein
MTIQPLTKEQFEAIGPIIYDHEVQDQFITGTYGHMNGTFKGCDIGCTIHSAKVLGVIPQDTGWDSHETVAKLFGLPIELPQLFDAIFEGTTKPFAPRWYRVLRHGADYSLVVPKLVIWMADDAEHGLRKIVGDDAKSLVLIDCVVALYRRRIEGDEPPQCEWIALANDADRAWAWAWAGAGAWARARAGAWARAGARAWDWAGARWIAIADKLIELLQAA